MKKRPLAVVVLATMAGSMAACGGTSSAATYDISPITFADSSCAKYGGTQSGQGINATCSVDLAECQRALADYNKGFEGTGVQPSVNFRCV